MVVQARNTNDVVAAVRFARQHGLPISVRGGGHNAAGLAVIDDGLVIDLSPMSSVMVDPETRIARAGGGTTWGDFDAATQAFGLATTGGAISMTGIGGLTLGGGLGYLMRLYGLAADNLIGAEVVLADGQWCAPAKVSAPSCCGDYGAAAATLASLQSSSSGFTRSTGCTRACCCIHATEPARRFRSIASRRPWRQMR